MNNKKSILQKIKLGIIEGWNLPILPDHVIKFDKNIYTKIFKLLGSIATVIIISPFDFKLSYHVYYLLVSISLPYLVYRLILVFYVIKHWFHNLITGKFIYKNSPVEVLNTIFKGTFNTIKGGASLTIGTGITYALCYELDDILISEGKKPYFIPRMKQLVVSSGLEGSLKIILDKIGIKDDLKPKLERYEFYFNNLSTEDKNLFEKEVGCPIEKVQETFELIEKNRNSNNSTITSESVPELIDKKDPFETKSIK